MMGYFGCHDNNPTVLESDNLGAIHLTNKSVFHGRTKHIEIQYHWICEIVNQGEPILKHCPTEDMVADLLTKALGKKQYIKLRSRLGIKTASKV